MEMKSNSFSLKERLSRMFSAFRENVSANAKYYKRTIIIMIITCVIAMIACQFLLTHCAEDYDKATGLAKTLVGTSGKNNGWIDDIFGTTQIDKIKDLLAVELTTDLSSIKVNGSTLDFSALSSIYKVFKNIGVWLLVVYFGIGMFEDFSLQSVYQEKMVKKIIILIVSMVCVLKGAEIVYSIANMGSALVDKVATSVESGSGIDLTTFKNQIYEDCSTAENADGTIKKMVATLADFGTAVSYLLQLLIPWAISMLCNIGVNFIAWSRFFEILITGLIAPIGFADLAKGNSFTHTSAARLFKNAVALAVTGAVILMVCWISNQIQGQIIVASSIDRSNYSSAVWQCVLISIVQFGLVQRSTEITKSALGMV